MIITQRKRKFFLRKASEGIFVFELVTYCICPTYNKNIMNKVKYIYIYKYYEKAIYIYTHKIMHISRLLVNYYVFEGSWGTIFLNDTAENENYIIELIRLHICVIPKIKILCQYHKDTWNKKFLNRRACAIFRYSLEYILFRRRTSNTAPFR